MIAQRTLVLVLLSFVLAACGGGGGGTSQTTTPPPNGGAPNNPPPQPQPPPPPEPTDWDEYSAEHAQVRMTSIGTLLYMTWVDLFDNELGFRVERRIGEGSWEVVETLRALNGGWGFWEQTITAPARYRVTAMLAGRSIPLHSPGNETEIAVDPTNPPTIQIDQSEPVRGAVQVSVQNTGPAAAVTYTFDGGMFARSTSGGTFPAILPAQHLLDGQRALQVYIEKSPGLTVSRIRSVAVDNPAPAVTFFHYVGNTDVEPPQSLTLSAQASSAAGISAVEFFINGASVHVANTTYPGTDQYIFHVTRERMLPGANVFRVVATDGTNATVAQERTIQMDAAPTLNVTGLSNGMIAAGSAVRISGDFSDDVAGAFLTIDLDGRQVLRTLNSPFALDLPLAGVPVGEHSVNLRVHDLYGRVTSRSYRIIVPST